jgi:lauroyl/myristoyl acyltransferase
MNTEWRIKAQQQKARPFFLKEDLLFCLELPALWAVSWFAPERTWKAWCYRLEWIKSRLNFFSPRLVASTAARVLSEKALAHDGGLFELRHAASRSEHHVQILRSYRPGGWQPSLVLEGEQYLNSALRMGNGAVLWIAHFSFNSLATKMALARAGFDVAHLSRPEHGFSKSSFGIRVLNPIRVHAELRYLPSRIVIDRLLPAVALRTAEKRLRANEIISITAGSWEGRRVIAVNLLGGTIELAAGAPGIALITGAELFPVFTVRDPADGLIKVIIDRPITKPSDRDLSKCLASMTQEFVDRMEPFVTAYPEQWRDWKNLKFDPRIEID